MLHREEIPLQALDEKAGYYLRCPACDSDHISGQRAWLDYSNRHPVAIALWQCDDCTSSFWSVTGRDIPLKEIRLTG